MDINEKILKELKNYLLQNIGDEISDTLLVDFIPYLEKKL